MRPTNRPPERFSSAAKLFGRVSYGDLIAGFVLFKETNIAVNPYPPGCDEHETWERWLRVFLAQPAFSQFFDAELQLRLSVGILQRLSAQITEPQLRQQVRAQLDELLTTGQLLKAAGEHAFAATVANPSGGPQRFAKDLDPSA